VMAATIPLADFTPLLLQQTALRASLLQTRFGFAADEWGDLRQDLALDCLRRLPRFDRSRGNWQGFVRGVVRHHACVLALQHAKRPMLVPFAAGDDEETSFNASAFDLPDSRAEEVRRKGELRLDVERVVSGLPSDLRELACLLSAFSFDAVRRRTGLTAAQLDRQIRRIRAAFIGAGIKPSPVSRGGAQ